MPSGLRKTTGNHFEIYYEQPWGGVASNVNPVDIQPNQLAFSQGVIDINGELGAVSVSAGVSNFAFNPHTAGAFITVIWTMGGLLYALDQFGNIYNNVVPASGFVFFTTATDGPWVPPSATDVSTTPVKVLNGTAYISIASRHSIYTFNGTTFAIGSNYSGSFVLGVLNNYLVQLNVNSNIDGLQPNRISWSGPGLFTTWDPSVNRTAGFNTLSNVDDELVGFLSLASVGVAISAKTLIELSPTGVAIGPFSFTALWTSDIGRGCVYPKTIVQYGQFGYMTTDSSVYSLTTAGGMTDVASVASEAIFASFQQNAGIFAPEMTNGVAAGILLYFYNSSYPTPYYVLAAQSQNQFPFIYLWFLDLSTGTWYSAPFNFVIPCNQQNGTSIPLNGAGAVLNAINVTTMQPLSGNTVSFDKVFAPITLVYYTLSYGGTNYTTVAQVYAFSRMNNLTLPQTASVVNLSFRAEEIKLGRQPTIRRVLVKAYGNGTLNLTVNGVSFGSIVLNGTQVPKTYESTGGFYTGEAPQLNITSNNFLGSIIKIMLGGTYADGDID